MIKKTGCSPCSPSFCIRKVFLTVQRLFQHLTQDIGVALALGSSHTLTYQEAQRIGLTAAVVLYHLGVGCQNITNDLFQRTGIVHLAQTIFLYHICRGLIAEDDFLQHRLASGGGDLSRFNHRQHIRQLLSGKLGIGKDEVFFIDNASNIAQQPVTDILRLALAQRRHRLKVIRLIGVFRHQISVKVRQFILFHQAEQLIVGQLRDARLQLCQPTLLHIDGLKVGFGEIAVILGILLGAQQNVLPGGKLFINSSIIDKKATRTDIDVYYVPCNEIADKLNNPKVANMAMLGAYLEATKAVQTKSVLDALLYKLGEKKAALIPLNEEAIEAGAASIRK